MTTDKYSSIKGIITFILIGVTSYLAVVQKLEISSEFFASIVSAVITYYFTKDANKTENKE